MRQHTNSLASCAGLKSSQSPQWVWRTCVPGRLPNQMRICSLAQRQSIWFVHLSCIDSRVDTGVPLPRLTSGHVLSLPEGPHWFTKPVSTENSYTAQTQLEESSELTHCWFPCNRITWIAVLKTRWWEDGLTATNDLSVYCSAWNGHISAPSHWNCIKISLLFWLIKMLVGCPRFGLRCFLLEEGLWRNK